MAQTGPEPPQGVWPAGRMRWIGVGAGVCPGVPPVLAFGRVCVAVLAGGT
jgi:hypothetical protein